MKASKRESKRKNLLDKLSFKKNEITKSINNINIDLSQQVEIERFSSCINKQIILCQQHLKDLIKQVKLISPNSETDSDEEIEKFTDFLSDTESSETAKFLNENKILKKLKELEKIIIVKKTVIFSYRSNHQANQLLGLNRLDGMSYIRLTKN